MRIAIYNPYLDTLGGGERYTMAFARVAAEAGYKVDIEWIGPLIGKKLEERFGLDLKEINFVPDIKRGDGYEVCFWVSDGSIPTLLARKNLLHFQVPFKDVGGRTLLNKFKLFRINKIICNSYFTKKFIDKEYGVESIVIYPPVDIGRIKPKRKENIILYVGRFSTLGQSKNQDILIDSFKKLVKNPVFSEWRLVLAGGAEVGATDEYLTLLKKKIQGFPIELVLGSSYKEIISLYGRAKIFWSAAGYGINEEKEPQKVEHFGITLVEAMSAGCVPIVFKAGGFKEIVENDKNGYLWEKPRELIKLTQKVLDSSILARNIAKSARASAQQFSYERFKQEILQIL